MIVKLLIQLRLQMPSTHIFSSIGNDLARTIPSVEKKRKIIYTIVSNQVSLFFSQLLVKLKMKFPN